MEASKELDKTKKSAQAPSWQMLEKQFASVVTVELPYEFKLTIFFFFIVSMSSQVISLS